MILMNMNGSIVAQNAGPHCRSRTLKRHECRAPWFVVWVLALVVAGASALFAQNPVLPGDRADPEINHFEGKYWLYTTAQNISGSATFRAFSSTNLTSWADEGEIFNFSSVSWAQILGWAPSMAYRNGTYYFYFSVGGSGGGHNSSIGVATGPTPKGPFTDALGGPLVTSKLTSPTIEAIDPHVFIDDDGQVYMYYAGSWGSALGVQRLGTNMITTEGPLMIVTGLTGFTEAPFLCKRNGIYYLSYSGGSWNDWTYNVRYATANSPMGPWTYRGQILTADATHLGPGHHSFIQAPGTDNWYIAYHYWNNLFSTRHTAVDEVKYNPDGTIQPIQMTGGGSIKRWEAYNAPGQFIRQTNFQGRISADVSPLSDSQFFVVPGLANPAAISFASIRYPNRFLRHRSGQIHLDTYDGSTLFRADATFFQRPGLGNTNHVSFESFNFPGQHIRHRNGILYRELLTTANDRNDGTFIEHTLYPVPLRGWPALRHRWTFNDGTGADSVGDAHATLVGAASYSGGRLHIPGGAARVNGATVNIASTLATNSNLTVEGWFTMNTLQNWAKLWMFGRPNDGAEPGLSYIDFTPRAGASGNVPSMSLNSGLSRTEVNTRGGANPSVLTAGVEIHVAAVYHATSNTMQLYINGALADSATLNGLDVTQVQATEAWFGAPVHYLDNNLNGSINELRIWDGPLTASQVATHYALGPNALPQPTISAIMDESGMIVMWPETFAGFTLESSSETDSAIWTPVSGTPAIAGGHFRMTLPVTNVNRFFRLVQ